MPMAAKIFGAKPKEPRKRAYYGPSFGYGRPWRRVRLFVLQRDKYTCKDCGKLANEVDHIIPHKGNSELYYDTDNMVSRCKSCHARKTVKEDGGFGNAVKRS